MTIDEAIALLKAKNLFYKFFSAGGITILGKGGSPGDQGYDEVFGIDKLEEGVWTLSFETGALPSSFCISPELEEAVYAAIAYFQILNIHPIDATTLKIQLLYLQLGGLVAEIDGSAAITCRESSVRSREVLLQKYRYYDTDKPDLLEFMLKEKDPQKGPLYILTPSEQQWVVLDRADETQPVEYAVATLEEAVQQVLDLYSGTA